VKENQVNISVYIPKYQRRWLMEVEAWVKETYPDMNFSDFILDCIRDSINRLNPEETKNFETVALRLTEQLYPAGSKAANKYFKTGDQNGKTKS